MSNILPYGAVILLLCAVEAGLREWAPWLNDSLVSEVRYDGIDWYRINPGSLRKYFPRGTPLVPEFKSSLFRKQKAPGAVRILCLGESSMFGTPYMISANIPGILRSQLRHRFPDREIEVINLGASAINSNVVLDLCPDLGRYEPDYIVVYMGHNEFYGPDGVGASFLKRFFPSLIPLSYRLRELRLVKLLLGLFPERRPENGDEQNLMRLVSGGSRVRLGSSDARYVLSLFNRNLSGIIDFWKERHVPVLVSDVSSNLLFPPFMYDTLDAGKFAAAVADVHAGDHDAASRILSELRGVDSTNAFVNYWQGRLDLAQGDTQRARVELMQARDHDLLKFRAPSEIDTIIHQVCESEGVPTLPADSLFEALSPGRIPGDNLFWEHLHPTARGYYEIATMISERIVRMIDSRNSSIQPLPFDYDSLGICWLDRACGDIAISHLTGRWPFANYRRDPEALTAGDSTLQRIAMDTYIGRYPWDEGCYNSADHFIRIGKLRDAETSYEAVLGEYPTNYYAHYLLGRLLSRLGETARAIGQLGRSIDSKGDFPNARLELGLNLINVGSVDEALRELDTALELARSSGPVLQAAIYYGIAAATANKGDFTRALTYLDESLSLRPGYPDALSLRDQIQRKR